MIYGQVDSPLIVTTSLFDTKLHKNNVYTGRGFKILTQKTVIRCDSKHKEIS